MSHPCDRVLVVNDDPLVLQAIADALAEEGIEVTAARDTREALAILRAGPRPDVVLLDLQLSASEEGGRGGDSGESLLGALRADPALARLPVVAVSASPWRLRRVESEVTATLEVPFSLERLEATLAEICSGTVA